MMHTAHSRTSGRSDEFSLNNFLSVMSTAIMIGIIAIENLKKSSVVWSIPF
jgi:hypothetical protein